MSKTNRYLIDGMDCGGCAASVETLLQNQRGVKSARVDFESKEAVIEHDDAFDPREAAKLVSQMGYAMTEK